MTKARRRSISPETARDLVVACDIVAWTLCWLVLLGHRMAQVNP